jgi:hypothetical protein
VRITLCAGVMVSALHWIAALGAVPQATLESRVWYLLGQLVIAALAFMGTAMIVRVEEMRIALGMIMEKFERRAVSQPENRDVPIA